MNAGAYVTGSQLKRLGEYYAKAIHDKYGDDFDVLFGPAYKGIPLGVVTAIAYSELYGKRSVTAQTVKKKKITEQIREASSEASSGRRPRGYDRRCYHIRQIHGRDCTEGKRSC